MLTCHGQRRLYSWAGVSALRASLRRPNLVARSPTPPKGNLHVTFRVSTIHCILWGGETTKRRQAPLSTTVIVIPSRMNMNQVPSTASASRAGVDINARKQAQADEKGIIKGTVVWRRTGRIRPLNQASRPSFAQLRFFYAQRV